MAVTAPSPPEMATSSDVLTRSTELASWLSRRSQEIERGRAVPADVLVAVADAGCLRMVVPAAYGGAGLSLPAAVRVIEELARVNSSLGWLIGQITLAHAVFGYLPTAAVDAIYASGPDVYGAGAAAPKGRAASEDGEWRVSGRWPLVSGCRNATWMYLQCLVVESNELIERGEMPQMRTVVMPAEKVKILETYRGFGLRATGSHDVHVSDVACPESYSCDLNGEPTAVGPAMCMPVATQAGLVAAGVLTGTATAALDAVLSLAANKRPAFSSRRLAQSPLFQAAVGEAHMTLTAGRALLYSELARATERTYRQNSGSEDAHLRAAAAKTAALAVSVVDSAYSLGGSSSIVEGSPLERRLRDARSISQHAAFAPVHFSRLGAATAGAEVDPSSL
jgi:indole-3-acetate monooxygenase